MTVKLLTYLKKHLVMLEFYYLIIDDVTNEILGCGALSGKILLLRIIENIKIGQVMLIKVCFALQGLRKGL